MKRLRFLYISVLIYIILLGSRFHSAHSWGWFSSSSDDGDDDIVSGSETGSRGYGYGSDKGKSGNFDIDAVDNPTGKQLVQDAKNKLATSPSLSQSVSCWHKAYGQLFASCKEILQNEEKKSRLAYHMSECFQKESGRSPLPQCQSSSAMIKCLKKLNKDEHQVYLAFFINTNAMCHHLQSHAFKQDTERVVNELKSSAHWAVDKLGKIEKLSDSLLARNDEIDSSLLSIESHTSRVAEKQRAVEDKVTNVLDQHNAIFEQSNHIIDIQSKLQEEQLHMQKTLDSSMANLVKSYVSLGEGIGSLQTLTKETQIQINEVAGIVSSHLDNLQTKADNIGNVVAMSLDQQKQLLDAQSLALQGLDTLSQHQAEAFEASRTSLHQLTDYVRQQQLEFTSHQQELQQNHQRLAQTFSKILAAQEAFESKQSTMLMTLDKLFSLHNAILVESRAVKAVFFYLIMICVLYVLTSAKQTNNMRGPLYLGLCSSFAIEFFMIRFNSNDLFQQEWILSKIFYVRTVFMSLAVFYLIYSLIRYRDYERLNYKMLLEIQEKMKTIESNLDINQVDVYNQRPNILKMDRTASQHPYARNIIKRVSTHQGQRSMVGGMGQSPYPLWLDANLGEDDSLEDPDYELPLSVREDFARTLTPKTYNLRSYSQ